MKLTRMFVVFSLFTAVAAHAAPSEHKMMAALNLTDAQKTAIKAIREKNKEAMKAQREKRKEAFQSLQALLQNNEAEDGAIRDAYKKVQSLKAESADARFETLLEIRKQLTPEQRSKFRGMMMERFKEGGGRGKFRRHGRGAEAENEDEG